MKSIDQLRDFFNNELKSDLKAIEGKRLSIVYKVVASVVIMAGLLVAILYFIFKNEMSIGWTVLPILVMPVLAWMLVQELISNRSFYNDFKTQVIERILKFIDPSFTYISHKYIQPAQLVDSKLFSHLPKKYKGDDYVSGIIGQGTKVEFSEVVARHKDLANASGKGGAEWNYTFKGLYFVAQTDRKFDGQTFLLPANETTDSLLQSSKLDLKRVDFDGEEFSNFFHIYSTQPDEAKTLVNAPIRERLVEFRSHRTNPVRISFVGNRINVAISHEKDLFEPRIFKTLIDFKVIEEYYDDLYQAISLMESVEGTKSSR